MTRCLGTSRGSSSTTSPRAAHRAARRRLLHLRRASGCLGMSRDSSSTTSPTPRIRVPRHIARLVVDYFALRSSSSTTSPRAGSSSTTSPTSHDQVPRHVTRLIARLVVDYFAYAAHLGASECRATRRASCRRLLCLAQLIVNLRLHRASGCLGSSHGSSLITCRLATRLLIGQSH
jgi:hypothetical protein